MQNYEVPEIDEIQLSKIEDVNISAAGFIGYASRGPIEGQPTRLTSISQFTRIYGEPLGTDFEYRFLYYAVEMFFYNGGDVCYVMRVEGEPNPDTFLGTYKPDGHSTGLAAFQDIEEVTQLIMPGVTIPTVLDGLIAYCEKRNCFAIIDAPVDMKTAADLLTYRNHFDSSNAAIYHPWLLMFDHLLKKYNYMPPSGAIAGIYALTDNTRGFYKAPANETIRSCTDLSVSFNAADQDKLNPKGINLIRAFPRRGCLVWGARTMSSQSDFKYINIQRLLIYLQKVIRKFTKWALHLPNDEQLWQRLTSTIQLFLTEVWHNGALTGASPGEAFYVMIGRSTMTDDDIQNGRIVIQIGVAPMRPGEFIIFQITLQQ